MNYSPGTAIGFYAYPSHNNLVTYVVCRDCFNSDSAMVAEEFIYPPIALDCDFCGDPL